MKRTTITMALAAFIAVAIVPHAIAQVLVEFDRVRSDELAYAGFHIDSEQEVRISDMGYAYRSSGTRFTLSNAWILDSKTRDAVWDLQSERDEWKSKKLIASEFTVKLPAGDYEVYYSTFAHYHKRTWSDDIDFGGVFRKGSRGAIDRVLEDEDVDDVEDLYRRFSFRVEGAGRALSEADVDALTGKVADDAIVSLRRRGDHEFVEQGFELKKQMNIRIYAVGEGNKDGLYDYAWIMNVDTRKKVWRASYSNSEKAGGAKKNRLIDDTFEAPAGRYVLVFTSDDSHSWERWNSSPPYDPTFWGVTLMAADAGSKQYASLFDYEEEAWKNIVADLTRVGDDELVKMGFTLKKDMDLRVYALGEGTDGEMYDYGWIIDAKTRQRVWTMSYDETEHAGGAKKNRLFDGVVSFKKGSYVAYYATDGSHSYPNWNSAEPIDRRRWGLTIAGTNGFKKGDVTDYSEKEDGDALVVLTEVGDDAYVSKTFTLKSETVVNILALGEGMDGRMYDYGWIEDEGSGRVVWEMTYRKTEHAGGARKNRVFSDAITLKAGTYRVFYETDGSHSYGDWNSSRPYEPHNWGITVRVVPNS